MAKEQVVILVDFDSSTCLFCGLGALYGAKKHKVATSGGSLANHKEEPCGKRFTHTASTSYSNTIARDIVSAYPKLPFLGAGEAEEWGDGPWKLKVAKSADKFNLG